MLSGEKEVRLQENAREDEGRLKRRFCFRYQLIFRPNFDQGVLGPREFARHHDYQLPLPQTNFDGRHRLKPLVDIRCPQFV